MRQILARKPWPQTSLNRVVGPERGVALIRAGLDRVRHIARSHDATVNDVLLAVTADGVRGLRPAAPPLEAGPLRPGELLRAAVAVHEPRLLLPGSKARAVGDHLSGWDLRTLSLPATGFGPWLGLPAVSECGR